MGVELPTGGGDQRARAEEEEADKGGVFRQADVFSWSVFSWLVDQLTREEYLDKLIFSADQCFAD